MFDFDSNLYGWVDMTFILAGRDVAEITRVRFKRTREKEFAYGKGGEPLAIKSGNAAHEVEFEMLDGGYDKLVDVSPRRDITKLRGLIAAVSFGNPEEGRGFRTTVISGIQFSESGKEVSQGDKTIKVALPGLALSIQE